MGRESLVWHNRFFCMFAFSYNFRLVVACALASKLFDIYSAMLLSMCGCSFHEHGGDGCALFFVAYLIVCGYILCAIIENL